MDRDTERREGTVVLKRLLSSGRLVFGAVKNCLLDYVIGPIRLETATKTLTKPAVKITKVNTSPHRVKRRSIGCAIRIVT